VKAIFVGGVHGVGKTTCCSEVARLTGCVHVSASDIIRSERADAIASLGKLVSDVEGNQNLLIRGFDRVRREAGEKLILLDGHFAMRDNAGKAQSLKADVFKALRIDHLVCLIDAAEAIAARRELRDGIAPTREDIAELQDAERQNARLIAAVLEVALTELPPGDVVGFKKLMFPTEASVHRKWPSR
jgi:adenylate kinase